MRILVTGGAGFIGSHLVDAFIEGGHDVVVVDNLWAHGGGRRENLHPRAAFVHMDVRDQELKRVFRDFKPEHVCHHAAQHSVAIGTRDPQFDAGVNILGTLNVLEAAVLSGTRKIVFASSAATYGDVTQLPVDERTPQHPVSPYGISKMAVEHYLRYFRSARGLDFTALRYGNVFGPRQDPNGEAGVIAVFVGKFLANEGIRIDWDGEQTRDYVYVADVVSANLAALTRGSAETYVIGAGVRTSVNAIYAALATISGVVPPIARAARRPGDIRDIYFDPSKAARELDWHARIDLPTGMRRTFDYFRERNAIDAAV